MKFLSFEIKNYKGIEHARIDLQPAGANVFTLIGLNESGKTTVLEAISRFGLTREDTQALHGLQYVKGAVTTYVPKHKKANFSGDIVIVANVQFDPGEKEKIVADFEKATGSRINASTIPEVIQIEHGYRFENSDFKENIYTWTSPIGQGKAKGAKKERPIEKGHPLWQPLISEISKSLPQIVYFPTFLFNHPDKVILNPGEKETTVNRFYRQVIQNVANSLDRPLDIKKHLVDRFLVKDDATQRLINLMFLSPDKQQQIAAALNQLEAHLTNTIFESWSKIFGGTFTGREIILRAGVQKSEAEGDQVYVQFALKDGATQYDIAERSLGFRWFFSFLLFTIYRVSSRRAVPTLFLFDEPASNLHSRAQMQLLDSLPKIAHGSNQILYSTHSHYMINPEWLDQAFIVSNRSVDYDNIDEGNRFIRTMPTDINIERYRAFVASNPQKFTYFQPVLDKLEVAPSRLELVRPSILVEGKGDFFILEYGRRVLAKSKSKVAVVPTRGAAGMDELIGLLMGWGVPFAVCLDADKPGKTAEQKYIREWGASSDIIFTLEDVDPALKGKRIEDFLEDNDRELIAEYYGILETPSKSQIQLFFSEHLAAKKTVKLSSAFKKRIIAFEEKIANSLAP